MARLHLRQSPPAPTARPSIPNTLKETLPLEEATGQSIQHKRSLWRGALISPWVVPTGLALLLGIIGLVASFGLTDEHLPPERGVVLGIVLMVIVFGVPFTYLVTFLFVVPMALLLRTLRVLSAATLCLWCILLGPTTMYAFAWLLKGQPEKVLEPLGLAMAASYGLISGAAFCMASGVRLWVHRQPQARAQR